MRIYLTIFLIICTCNVLLSLDSEKFPKCFNFTWPGLGLDRNCINCTAYNKKYPYIPCINPICNETKPDTNELWDNFKSGKDNRWVSNCDKSSVCITYTYIYNGMVINASYFCGKFIEDQAIAVTESCFVTYTEGYTIEACACQSEAGGKPCNSTIRNTYSMLLLIFMTIVPLFIYKIFNIP